MQILFNADYPPTKLTSQGTDSDSHHLFDFPISVKGSIRTLSICCLMQDMTRMRHMPRSGLHLKSCNHLNARPCIDIRKGAVIQNEGNEERIRHWVNKL